MPRRTTPHIVACATEACVEMPLFDPRTDEIPFPFAAPQPSKALADDGVTSEPRMRYAFDRPLYLRMLRGLLREDGSVEDETFIGHCVRAGGGEAVGALALGADSLVRVGTIGVAVRLYSVEFAPRPGASFALTEGFGDEVALAAVQGAWRFEVTEVTSTFPFPTARVRKLSDLPPDTPEACAQKEAELSAALRRLVELSAAIETRGEAAEAAEAALEAPTRLVDAHETAVAAGLYQDLTERFEAFSLNACDLLNLPHSAAVAALSTTSAAERFDVLLDQLRPTLSELGVLRSLDDAIGVQPPAAPTRLPDPPGAAAAGGGSATGAAVGADARPSMLGGTTAFSPIDIPMGAEGAPAPVDELPDGSRIEFWYNEDFGWIAATVRRKVRLPGGEVLHTLEFDVDGTWEDIQLFSWQFRPLREGD